jgi:hypothetical protein
MSRRRKYFKWEGAHKKEERKKVFCQWHMKKKSKRSLLMSTWRILRCLSTFTTARVYADGEERIKEEEEKKF